MRRVGGSRKGKRLVRQLIQIVSLLGFCSWILSISLTKTRDLVPEKTAAQQVLGHYGGEGAARPGERGEEDVPVDPKLVDLLSETLGSREDGELWLRTHPHLVDYYKNRASNKFSIRNINHERYNALREGGLSEGDAYFLSFAEYPEPTDLFVSAENVKTLKSGQSPSKKALEHFLPKQSPEPKFSSCAVVGNGGVLKRYSFGRAIDGHDAVLRLNQAPVKSYEKIVGSKTTFRVLNNK